VTATNSAGSNFADVTITVNAGAPTISISPSSVTGTLNTLLTITPTVASNGATITCSITAGGALPTGLSLNTSTCVISGTPTATKAATTYTITPTNSAGSAAANVSITINGYVCTSNGFDGPAGTVASINNCYYNCTNRNQCGGTTLYYPSTCTNKTQVYAGQTCTTEITGYATETYIECPYQEDYYGQSEYTWVINTGVDCYNQYGSGCAYGAGSIGCQSFSISDRYPGTATEYTWPIESQICTNTYNYVCQ